MTVSTNQLHYELNYFCLRHIINILLPELSRPVWENLDLGRVYRPLCIRSVLTTSDKILPYRPPTRLIRAKYSPIFKTVRVAKKYLNDNKHSSLHLARKYARIFVLGHSLSLNAHSFPWASLSDWKLFASRSRQCPRTGIYPSIFSRQMDDIVLISITQLVD